MTAFRKRIGRTLSPRERDVLELYQIGLTRPYIAQVLGVKPQTVKSTLTDARRKLGARNSTHAVALAIREGQL